VSESKPFEPTQSRLERARREGDVPRASELGAVASLAGTAVVLAAALPYAAGAAQIALANAARGDTSPGPYVTLALYATGASLCGTTLAVCATAAVTGGLHARFPEPNLSRLDPVAGIKRMLSRDAVLGGTRAAVTAAVAGCSLVPVVRDAFVVVLAGAAPPALGALALHAIERSVLCALAVGVAFGAGDALFERLKWRRRLRMTFDEMKRDLKANEGDPLIRSRRRAQHRALVRGAPSRLGEAAFVVTNPTHVAIALEYDPPEIAVPRVLIRAIDAGARLVKRRACDLGIPVVENAVLARTLLATTQAGAYIPIECYVAVAQIVAALQHEGALA
jgi:flagellar biosynthetic protein FlhB